MKRLLAGCLAAAALLAGCAAVPKEAGQGEDSPSAAYRAGKINDISDFILEREVVPGDYLRFLPEDSSLGETLQRYNEMTGQLTMDAMTQAVELCAALWSSRSGQLTEEELAQAEQISERLLGAAGDHWDTPEAIHQAEERIAHWALYENAKELCYGDPLLAHVLVPESGSSYGLWPGSLHGTGERAQRYEEYFALVDDLLDGLDALRDGA